MYLQIPVLIGLLASTLALPTPNETNSTLEKRAHYGWIGAFDGSNCRGNLIGPRPDIEHSISGGCTAFSPGTNNIAINFGTGLLSFSSVKFWSDANCKNVVDGPKTDYQQPSGGYGCTHLIDYEGSIGSVSIDG